MADPLAASAAISTLVLRAFTISKEVYTRTQEIANAPQHIQAITGDLEDFYSILGTLKMYLDEGSDLSVGLVHSAGRTNLERALDNCLLVFDRINVLVGSYKARGGASITTWRKMKYCFKSAETEALRSELAAHKLSLNMAISLVNFLNTNLRNAATQKSEAEITAHIRHMEEKLPEILQNIEEIKAAALSSGEARTSGWGLAPADAADAEVRSYLEQETASISGGFRTPLAPSIRTNAVEIQPDGTSSGATSTYHSALSYMPLRNKLQALPENCTQIFVRGPTEKTHVLQVDSSSTLEDIKATLFEKTGVPTKLLFLLWAGKVLPENKTLESLNVPHDSTLFCNVRAIGRGNGPIKVKLSDGRVFEIPYKGGMSILDLKTNLRTQEGLDGHLFLDGKKLEDNKTVADSRIFGGSTVHCALRMAQLPSRYLAHTWDVDPLHRVVVESGSLKWASPKPSKIKLAVEDWLSARIGGWPPIRRATKIAAFRSGIRAV